MWLEDNSNINIIYILLLFCSISYIKKQEKKYLMENNNQETEDQNFITNSNIYKHYQYKTALYNLVKRDFIVKYRRSILGILWSVLNPFLMMVVISAVFSYMFRFDVEHYPVYYLTGYILFTMFTSSTSGAISSIINSAMLIKKMYIPNYLFPVEKCLFEFINTSVSLIALAAVLIWFKIPAALSWLLIPLPFIYIFIFSVGIAFILSSLNVYFRDIGHLYSVVTKVLIYATPVFYPVTILPPEIMHIMNWNPLYHFIDYFRIIILDGQIPSLNANLICAAFAFGSFFTGAVVFRLLQRKFILYI